MSNEISVIILEDSKDDVFFTVRELEKAGYILDYVHIDNAIAFTKALDEKNWDIIISDYDMGDFNGKIALDILNSKESLDIPFILVSGAIGEASAVELMKTGCNDYIPKDSLLKLGPIVRREIADAKVRMECAKAEIELEQRLIELELSNRRQSAMIEENPTPMMLMGLDLKILMANRAYLKLTGISKDELLSMTAHDFVIIEKSGHGLKEALESKTGVTGFIKIRFPTGVKIIEQDTIPLTNAQGEVTDILAAYKDMTENHRVKEYLEAQVDRVSSNLEKLAAGDLDMELVVDDCDEYTKDAYNNFSKINNNLTDVRNAVVMMIDDAHKLAEAGVEGHLDVRAEVERHNGDFRKIVEGVNDMLDAVIGPLNVAVDFINNVAAGNELELITDEFRGDYGQIKDSVNKCHGVLYGLLGEIGALTEAGVAGRLDTRGNVDQFDGAWVQVVGGINDILDAVVGPLNVAAEYVDRISKGDIPEKVTDEWKGDFNEVKNNLNQCIDAVNLLVGDAALLAEAGVDGRLDTRADGSKHQGDFRQIVQGVNDTLDAVVGPLNVAAEYVDRISKGDIPEKVTDDWKGDFNEVKNNLNQCIDAVNLLVGDAAMLAKAGVEGRLDARADGLKHQGDFRKIVDGVNGTLDAIGAPIQETMAVLERMAINDYTTKIENEYAGDYAKLTDNLNHVLQNMEAVLNVVEAISAGDMHYLETYKVIGRRCENDRLIPSFVVLMENLQAVVDDANMLAQAGINGQLDVRADATRHEGAYGDVIGGINNCLDAVIGPMNVAAEYMDRIAKGDIPEPITQEYAGDFNEIKNNLNQCIGAINLLLADANALADAGVAGQLDVRADAKRHDGAYGDVIGGINNCLDAVIGPMNVAAEYMDRIGKGEIPDKITDAYAGDFNEIKNNLNQCIDGLGGLVEANAVLQKMAVNDYTVKVEGNYQGVFAEVADATNDVSDRLVHVQGLVHNVAEGDLHALEGLKNAGKRSENDRMVPSFVGMMENLQAVVDDANMLAQAGVNGQLDVRADATRHAGAYGDVIGGINNCLDAVVGPLNVAAEYVDRIGKGDVPEKITDEYAGDFNELKNNLNQCIDGLGGLVEADLVLQKMAANDYTVKVEGNYVGLYADVASSLNTVRDRLLHVQDTVQNIAGGDLSDLGDYKAVGRRSENDKLIPSIIGMMENLQSVVEDANMLAEAGVNGQLDVRADATRHAGAYGDVIGGINNCLDAVVGPMNVAAEYVDRIGKGDIPAKITDVYQGDFNELKNNLNQCIDAVNLLVVDTNMLVDAAVVGKLTARADVSQHAGDYAKIVGGINQTLDIINNPFREVNAAIVQLDVTTDETTRGADEIAKAAEQVAVTSQLCADLSTSLINQIEAVDRQIADLSASNEEIASTSQEVHEHAVQTARIGEKAQQLGAEANAKMNNVEIIAKQSVDEINTLNSRMKEIDNVVKQVNDITNQINLLALNAAIEAARAGEHGRGFAVVAGEVRNLAEEAKQATGQIDQVIAGVQAISAKTAEGIGTAHIEIGSGVASVNETIGALNEIVQGSQDMKVNIDEIAKAIEEQANMANRIVEAMEESGRLTRETQGQVEELASLAEEASASTEEIGSSIHEVKNMANDLKQTMDKFEV